MGSRSVEHYVRKFFEWYGSIIYRWKWPLFILPIILSAVLSTGFLRLQSLKVEDPAYVFTPRDARQVFEKNIFSFDNLKIIISFLFSTFLK